MNMCMHTRWLLSMTQFFILNSSPDVFIHVVASDHRASTQKVDSAVSHHSAGTKIRSEKISSRGTGGILTKFCASRRFPLNGILTMFVACFIVGTVYWASYS